MDDRPNQFWMGVAYAAHVMRHRVGMAHGATDNGAINQIESNPCCRSAVRSFAMGFLLSIERGIPVTFPEHGHGDGA